MNQNPIQYDPTLFAGTASYYSRYRFPYPQQFFDYLIETFGFDGTGTALDPGCGPGSLTIPLAPSFNKVIAMDPDDEMLQEARRAAEAAKVSNIEFEKGSSWDLSPAAGKFRFVIMGQSFHWMDRDQALKALYDLVEPKSGLAIVYQKRRAPLAIRNAEDEIVKSSWVNGAAQVADTMSIHQTAMRWSLRVRASPRLLPGTIAMSASRPLTRPWALYFQPRVQPGSF